MPIYRNKTAKQHNFAIVPGTQVPRSVFRMRQTRKQALDASELVPIMCEEILPGDTWQHRESLMARLATPIAPVIDDLDIETFYFFVPTRLLWSRWEGFITGTDDAATVPTYKPHKAGGGPIDELELGGVLDHFGLPPNTYANGDFVFNGLPINAYLMIFNEWFRDQNLQNEWEWPDDAHSQPTTNIMQANSGTRWQQECLRINKRHDYFTSSLPWPQKGTPIQLPLGATAPVVPTSAHAMPTFWNRTDNTSAGQLMRASNAANANVTVNAVATGGQQFLGWNNPNLEVDLSSATAATINAIRIAFQTQRMLEKDARGGSRYVEQLIAHFGVRSPDYRLQRPEYLGGSKIPVTVNPIAQTADYTAEPGDTQSALGNLGAEMHASGHKRTFTYAATEHGYIIGVAAARATPTYQQGTRRHWLRETRLDYYFPVFSHLGEQAVKTQEIYQTVTNTYNADTWGYQERHAEYRYTPNEITGLLRSTAPQPLDWWHYAEEFANEPALNAAFIMDKTKETLARSLATAPNVQWGAQIIMDIMHDSKVARLMPAYAVPGLVDHF